jgi:hypothetical protein
VSFAAITQSVATQRLIPKASVYFVMNSVRKLLDIPSYHIHDAAFVLNKAPHIRPLPSKFSVLFF